MRVARLLTVLTRWLLRVTMTVECWVWVVNALGLVVLVNFLMLQSKFQPLFLPVSYSQTESFSPLLLTIKCCPKQHPPLRPWQRTAHKIIAIVYSDKFISWVRWCKYNNPAWNIWFFATNIKCETFYAYALLMNWRFVLPTCPWCALFLRFSCNVGMLQIYFWVGRHININNY
jgi:hypothetical protein